MNWVHGSTAFKIKLAKIIYRLITVFISKSQKSVRNGVNYDLDLSEGIDLQVFITGGFQEYIYNKSELKPTDKAVIIDVGANIGVISLNFAKLYPNAKIFAFEPTDYAFDKFKRNLALNPELSKNIVLTKSFVSDENIQSVSLQAYSSWALDTDSEVNAIHKGVLKNVESVPQTTIDSFVLSNEIEKVDLIKIDTDGHELKVLRGAESILQKHKPQVIIELGQYLTESDSENSYVDILALFGKHSYKLVNKSGQEITIDNYKRMVPRFGTIDAFATVN